MPEFERLIKFMEQYPKINIMVIGHTDNVGDSEYNLQLSQMRSKFLVDKLIEYGVSPERLDWDGYGIKNQLLTIIQPKGGKK